MPTGALAYLLVLMSVPSNRCFGSIGDSYPESAIMTYGAGAASLKTVVWASGVSMSVSSRKVAAPRGWTFRSTSRIENFTSALVNGWPSWNLTPFCSVNVIVLPSALTCQDCASPGMGLRLKSYSRSPS